MTEAEWLAGTDSVPMLDFLRRKGSERKRRLFICACCRHLWNATNDVDREVVGVAEQFADGKIDQPQLEDARRRFRSGYARNFYGFNDVRDILTTAVSDDSNLPAEETARSLLVAAYWTGPAGYDRASINARYAAREAVRARQAMAVRCVFGNPFRPVAIDPTWLAWNDGTIPKIAHAIYDDRRFADLTILADALEEAGCTDADILAHCRGGGEHVRGCWVVDLLLGKG